MPECFRTVLRIQVSGTFGSIEPALKDSPRREVESAAQWRSWLRTQHAQAESFWLVTYKKHSSADKHVYYDALVDEALCFGWVDSQPRVLDATGRCVCFRPAGPAAPGLRATSSAPRR